MSTLNRDVRGKGFLPGQYPDINTQDSDMYLAILEKSIPILLERIEDADAELENRKNFLEQNFDYLLSQ